MMTLMIVEMSHVCVCAHSISMYVLSTGHTPQVKVHVLMVMLQTLLFLHESIHPSPAVCHTQRP